MVHLLQQKHSFMVYNKNNKARCKTYFLVVKMTISTCVNRKLLRMKSTTKQENNGTFKSTFKKILIVQALAPGVSNTGRRISGLGRWLQVTLCAGWS